jgi:hypothetical protein
MKIFFIFSFFIKSGIQFIIIFQAHIISKSNQDSLKTSIFSSSIDNSFGVKFKDSQINSHCTASFLSLFISFSYIILSAKAC